MEHSGHDINLLLSRWDRLAAAHDWVRSNLGTVGGLPVEVFFNEKAAKKKEGGLYVSTGVHGDECAPLWALLRWAESKPALFEKVPVILVPCFNPVGVVENTRRDGEGIDLNRNFQNGGISLIAAWQALLASRRFSMALNLHEDYDATGIYLYEISDEGSPGDSFLGECEDIIPRETADSVDGSEFENGLLSHEASREDIEQLVEEELEGGMPEAVYLYLNHTRNSFTFETPSEFELERRIAAHQRFLEVASRHLLTNFT